MEKNKNNKYNEGTNKEVKRRSRVTGAFPNQESVLRLQVSISVDINKELITGNKYYTNGTVIKKRSKKDRVSLQKSGTLP